MVKYIPSSLDDALKFLAEHDAYICAGGTDLMVLKRNIAGHLPKFDKDVIYVSNLKEISKIYEDDKYVHIGATATLDEIYNNKLTPELLKKAIGEVASVNIRHFATLAGNIANASPAGDTIVIDYLLDAELILKSVRGERAVKAKDFVLGIRKIDRQKDELITEILFPKTKYDAGMWYKVGSRKADSISKVSVAGIYSIQGGKVSKFALAYGSSAITVRRSEALEKEITGLSQKELANRIEEFVEKYSQTISPIDDQRSTKDYRLLVAKNITRKFLKEVVEAKHE